MGPGSFKSGDNYDNVPDVAAWQKAIATAGRPIHLELSWSLDIGHAADWKKYSNGWRIDTYVECYCNTLVTGKNSVNDRWHDAPRRGAARRARRLERPGRHRRRQRRDGRPHQGRAAAATTLWAINKCAAWFNGDDLTKLHSHGSPC